MTKSTSLVINYESLNRQGLTITVLSCNNTFLNIVKAWRIANKSTCLLFDSLSYLVDNRKCVVILGKTASRLKIRKGPEC